MSGATTPTTRRGMRRPLVIAALGLSAVAAGGAAADGTASARSATDCDEPDTGVELLGEVVMQTGEQFEGTEVGGLSAIAYAPHADEYVVLSDDRSEIDDARFYRATIDLSDGSLDDGDVQLTGVTTLHDADGAPYETGALDPEGVALGRHGSIYVSSEGSAVDLIDPFVNRYDADGQLLRELDMPIDYRPNADGTRGVRDNLALEALTALPHSGRIVTATENALAQDGPISTVDDASLSRILVYNGRGNRPKAEYVYATDRVPDAPNPPEGFATNGLVELLPVDHDTFLAMERSFADGVGNDIRIYEITLDRDAKLGHGDEVGDVEPLDKELVLNVEDDLGVVPDNIEGMTFGPTLPDGRRTLVLVADNNFSDEQVTQFVAVAI